ncbi:protein CFAP20DC [Protopterus annectens]|uniref:protein CFAP20DC n=1 Tax=Protopterus annectens TaxID=7888 RepID=UPI001CFBA90C|nr:protein CFAP20DC [Protopterus annectens]
MFKNEYQGGPFVEIFSAQGKDPVAKWKLCGSPSAIRKEFDKEVKGFIYILEGSSQTIKMHLPKDNKQTLGLIQRFLVLQIYVPLGQDFATELQITDLGNIKRRLYLSTVHKELLMTPLHAKIPLSVIKRKIWCNLCIDLVEFTSEIFKGAVFLSLDGVIISANCKLRKIFSMKLQPQDTVDEDGIYIIHTDVNELIDVIPRSCQISVDVPQVSLLLNMTKLKKGELKFGGQTLISSDTDVPTGKAAGIQNSRVQDLSHIAFGSKVLGPPPPTGRKPNSCNSREIASSLSNRTNRSSYQCRYGQGDKVDYMKRSQLPTSNQDRNKENIHHTRKKTDHLTTDQLMIPHPPREPSAEKNSTRRRLRVRSAGKEHTGLFKDEWHFPEDSSDSFQLAAAQQSTNQLQCSCSSLSGQLVDSDKENENECSESEPQLEIKDIFMYSSHPRSAPHGKSHSFSGEGFTLPQDLMNPTEVERRGARMEDDFYGSDNSEEDDLHIKFSRQTSSPQISTSASLSPQSMVLSKTPLQRLPRTSEDSPPGTSITASSTEPLPRKIENPLLKDRETDPLQKALIPTLCLSPTGSKPGFSLENPSTSKRFTGTQISELRTSVNRKSLREIPGNPSRLAAEHNEYDWRNYQSTKMSISELQMLESLRRQQNEELEEDGNLHGLSASQINNCNVSISTSSDDTTTWNSCLPQPANQGHHYQKEMAPLLHSNPRDWLNAFSPPIIPLNEELTDEDDLSSSMKEILGKRLQGSVHEDDDILTLLYDPCLNCYFDPETGKYYELA